jgi:hypothetical protein
MGRRRPTIAAAGRRGLVASVIAATLSFAALAGALSSSLAWGAAPDFSGVADILGGQRILLRDDDLVVSGAFGGNAVPSVLTLRTADSHVSPPLRSDLPLTSGHAVTAVGRMYAITNDVVATLAFGQPGNPATVGVRIVDPVKDASVFSSIPGGAIALNAITMADVNGDGYLDLIVEYTVSQNGHVMNDMLMVATAADVTNPQSGLRWGPPVALPLAPLVADSPFLGLAAGDFDGNGQPDVALVGVTLAGDTNLNVYTIAPASLALSLASTTRIAQFFAAPGNQASLAAGRFGTTAHDQLVLVGAQLFSNFQVLPIDFKGLQPVLGHIFDTGLAPGGPSGFARIRSGRIAWFGDRDQAALLLVGSGQQQVSILTFDANLDITEAPKGEASLDCVSDIALGNFDRRQSSAPPASTDRNPNLQLALLGSNCGSELWMNVYDVDPSSFQLAQVGGIVTALPGRPSAAGMSLVAGDTQGRSFLLGPPTKVTVTGSIQPDVILGMPPMHVDFVCGAANTGPRCAPSVLNLTGKPSKYFSRYETAQSASDQSSNTNTTSYTFGTKATIDQKASYKVPDTLTVSAELKANAQQTHNQSVAVKYNTYSSKQFDVSTQTGFSDLVWFTAKRFNVYVYQVLGHCEAALGNPAGDGCPAGTRPLYVQFSGPDQVVQHRIDGNLLEWYQPTQESGNVFSYPWSAELLKKLYPGFSALTPDPSPVWSTDTSGSSVSVQWTKGSGSSVTSGSVCTQSFDVTASVSGEVKIAGFDSTTSFALDYSSSRSVSTLNESTATLGASTGIKIVKPPFENPGQYAYAAQTYIFGQQAPAGTVQQIPLGTAVQSSGPLWTAFVADPTDMGDGAGAWWAHAYTVPDVALNHPLRWNWTPPSATTGDVMTFNAANRSNPADSEFYFMKGLYITSASADGQGPQIVQATAGDVIRLQARVYNYSLADMPAGTTVHVRFYGQPWDNTTHDFAGHAFPIDEVVLDPIPGFNSVSSGGAEPNWALASTTLDTGAHADTYLVFWVVVWMERNGRLLPEVAGHGLTALPAAGIDPADVAIEPYSNNVGFYNQPFFVAPRASAKKGAAAEVPGTLGVGRVSASPGQVALFERATIAATLTSDRGPVGSVLVLFYDGDPRQGAEAFDAELIAHIRADDVYVTKVTFAPRTCGRHTIFVEAQPSAATPASGTVTVDVQCAAVSAFTGKAEKVGSGKADGKVTLSGGIPVTAAVDLSGATVTVTSLLQEIGGGELVQGDRGARALPVTLTARRDSKPTGAIFETPSGARPSFRIEVKQRDAKSRELDVSIKVEGATIPRAPQGCSTEKGSIAPLRTSLSIAARNQDPVALTRDLTWQCGKGELKTP